MMGLWMQHLQRFARRDHSGVQTVVVLGQIDGIMVLVEGVEGRSDAA